MLAKEKNFTKAARKLHLSQPSLSYQISKLEKKLGVNLFIRDHNQVLPTYAGKKFISHANQILDQFQQLRNEIIDISDMKSGQLLLGSLSTTGAHLLPDAISIFQEKYPGVELILLENTSINLQSMVLNGEVEIALMSLPIKSKNIEKEVILEEDIFLAVPKNHWLSELEEVDLSLCKDESFILIKEGNNFRLNALELCQKAGFQPNIVFDSINIDTCQSLVSAGLGISFVPEMCMKDTESANVPVYLPLRENDNKPKRQVVIIYKNSRYLSNSSKTFINILKSLNN